MDRKEFLALLGMGAAGVIIPTCMGGCSKDSGTTAASIDKTFDLNSSTYSSLTTTNGFLDLSEGVRIVNTGSNNFIAFQARCPHDSGIIEFDASTTRLKCNLLGSDHGNVYSNAGTYIGGNNSVKSNLKTYACTYNSSTKILSVKG